MKDQEKGGLAETAKTIGVAIFIALFIRTFLFEPFNIPSSSMVPTLLVGDYLFVSKYAYGFSRYSFPFGVQLVPGPDRVMLDPPERGDVAVFKLPLDNKTDYIKRIIGLPGDTVQMIKGELHINGEKVDHKALSDYPYHPNGNGNRTEMVPRYLETLPNGKSFDIIEIYGQRGSLDDTVPFTVPEGHYFAMGDNRDNSTDSRAGNRVGMIPEENLVGRAEMIFFSTNGSADIWEIWKWPDAIRWERLFKTID